MKPHLLVMSAFGPYGKQVEVDFDRFDGKGLFLITGDTGAGKTTIFNAMTYALYGMMNDGRRKSIRSDFADPSTPTFVEMMFSHNGVDYTIRRQPEQERPKQRGKGTKIVASGVSLVFQDRTVTKDSEVSEIIKDILGMDFNQWKQVSMIAQGEFRKILDSKTTERGEIFRRIFSTDPVKRFQEILSDMASDRNGEFEQAKVTVSKATESFDIPDGPYSADYMTMRGRGSYASEILELVSKQNGMDGSTLTQLDTEYGALREKEAELVAAITEAESLNSKIDSLEAAEKVRMELESRSGWADSLSKEVSDIRTVVSTMKVPRSKLQLARDNVTRTSSEVESLTLKNKGLEGDLAKARSRHQDASAKEPEVKDLMSRVSVLDSMRERYSELESLDSSIQNSGCILEDLESRLDSALARKGELAAKVEGNRAFLKDHSDDKLKLERYHNEREALESKLRDLDEISDLALQYRRSICARTESEVALVEARARLESESVRFGDMEDLFLRSQAGMLASRLGSGAACPVCGSTHHPAPAILPDDTPSKKDLDSQKSKVEKASATVNKYEQEMTVHESTIASSERQLRASLERMGVDAPDMSSLDEVLEDLHESITVDLKDTDTCILLTEPNVRRCEEINNSFPQLDRDVKENSDEIEALRTEHSRVEQEVSNMRGRRGALSDGLTYGSLAQLDAEIMGMRSKAMAMEGEIEAARLNLIQSENMLTANEASLKSLSSSLEIAMMDLDEAEMGYGKLLSMHGLDDGMCVQLLSREPELVGMEAELSAYRDEVVSNRTTVESLTAEIAGRSRVDTGTLVEERSELSSKVDGIKNDMVAIKTRMQLNDANSVELRGSVNKLKAIEADCGDLLELNAVASGNVGVKQTFEAYVQSMYFKRVLAFANRRFTKMSDGRYELVIREMVGDKRSQFGLDIDVLDHYTGKRREANTLSGGESFLAALSLALGLSDAVQRLNGGIRIETLFVDEGFGSLDPEALDQAISVLMQLSQGDCLIGIISHVEALKNQMDRKIIVHNGSPGSSGSFLEVEF